MSALLAGRLRHVVGGEAERYQAAEDARRHSFSEGGRMRKWMLLGIFAVGAVAGAARNVEAGCTTDLAECYQRAARIDSFWYRWAVGLDCELDFVDCGRRKIIGR
jgi:hypothetical protein